MMLNPLKYWLEQVSNNSLMWVMRRVLVPVYDRASSVVLNTPGLAIKSGGSAIVKTGAADCYLMATGVLQVITAATDMPALAGTVTNAQFGAYCFYQDRAGTRTMVFSGSFASLALLKFPQIPNGKAFIGFVLVNPTGTGDFIGGTTALDDGTVAPGAVYVNNTLGSQDQNMLVGAPFPN